MTEKQVKTLEKLLAQEARADQEKVKRAVKDMHKMEKAYQNSIKETEKAQKTLLKAAKAKSKSSKTLDKAQSKLQSVTHARATAEKQFAERMQQEDLEQQDLQQRHLQISQAFEENYANDKSRALRRSEFVSASGAHAQRV